MSNGGSSTLKINSTAPAVAAHPNHFLSPDDRGYGEFNRYRGL